MAKLKINANYTIAEEAYLGKSECIKLRRLWIEKFLPRGGYSPYIIEHSEIYPTYGTFSMVYDIPTFESDLDIEIVRRANISVSIQFFVVMNPGERGITGEEFLARTSKLGKILYG